MFLVHIHVYIDDTYDIMHTYIDECPEEAVIGVGADVLALRDTRTRDT